MTSKHYLIDGQVYRGLHRCEDGVWVIACSNNPSQPFLALHDELEPTEAPAPSQPKQLTAAQIRKQKERLHMLQPLINSTEAIYNSSIRRALIRDISSQSGKSIRTIQRLYYAYLSGGADALFPAPRKLKSRIPPADAKNIRWAIRKYHYSSRKLSLQKTYEMMLIDKYLSPDGVLANNYPTFSRFKHFFYDHIKNDTNAVISRKGLSYYQRNSRPLYGKVSAKTPWVGTYEMDATEADVYLVSRYDRTQTIGRPFIYLAVDRATQLIAGIYVGLKGGEEAVIECLRNAVSDKVDYCKKYDIEITSEQWPASGIPGKLVTDRGLEFASNQIKDLCSSLNISLEILPPYRPELKGIVESTFSLLQGHIKPALNHHGGIEPDFAERGAPDYRLEATLTLEEYTKLVILSVIHCNSMRILQSYLRSPEMAAAQIMHTPAAIWKWLTDNGYSSVNPFAVGSDTMCLLARGKAHFTRRGLEFQSLTYRNNAFNTRCVTAGIKGKETVTIAYLPNNTSKIWLFEDEEYYEFELTSASDTFTGLSFDEVQAYLRRESDARREGKSALLPESLANTAAMRDIVKTAASFKTEPSSASQLSYINQAREREANIGES